jgi:predicted nucleic acid-binding protein
MSSSVVCVDACLVIRLVADPADEVSRRLWDEWDAGRREIVAPGLLFYEVSNVLYRYARAGLIGEEAARLALSAALALPIRLIHAPEVHIRALEIAHRFSLAAAYDAHYLAVADMLSGEFWTGDLKLAHVVSDDLPWVRGVER